MVFLIFLHIFYFLIMENKDSGTLKYIIDQLITFYIDSNS